MKILFVYKGIGAELENPVVLRQHESLQRNGHSIYLFPLISSGINGYIKEFFRLRKFVHTNHYNLIHAHYSYSAFISGLLLKQKVICSLMGSDVFSQPKPIRFTTWLFYRFIWKATITKSSEMQQIYPNSVLIPNGVDFDIFTPIDSSLNTLKTELNPKFKNILFIAVDPESKVKNLNLAKKAIKILSDKSIKLHILHEKTPQELNYYYNLADLLLLTSFSEGSPNVIKEAMACNLPIVSTDVGDVREVVGNTAGCYITSFEPGDVAEKIKKALEFGKKTNGRENIKHLDNKIIAEKIIRVYQQVING